MTTAFLTTLIIYATGTITTAVILLYTRTPSSTFQQSITGCLSLVWPLLLTGLLITSVAGWIAVTVIDRLILFIERRALPQPKSETD
jgi:hypothetical protein